jgi:hypothetical protein
MRRPKRGPPGSGLTSTTKAKQLYLRYECSIWVIAAAISYIFVGLNAKILLNWVVGPLWPVVFVWLGPPAVRRLTGWKDALP